MTTKAMDRTKSQGNSKSNAQNEKINREKQRTQELYQKKRGKIRENIGIVLSAIFIAIIIRVFLVEAYMIPTESMYPNLRIGDHLLVNKFLYGIRIPVLNIKLPGFTQPQSGDIVVFQVPNYTSPGAWREFINLITFGIFNLDNTQDNPKNFIKRAIGVPGDVIRISRDGIVERGNQETEWELKVMSMEDTSKVSQIYLESLNKMAPGANMEHVASLYNAGDFQRLDDYLQPLLYYKDEYLYDWFVENNLHCNYIIQHYSTQHKILKENSNHSSFTRTSVRTPWTGLLYIAKAGDRLVLQRKQNDWTNYSYPDPSESMEIKFITTEGKTIDYVTKSTFELFYMEESPPYRFSTESVGTVFPPETFHQIKDFLSNQYQKDGKIADAYEYTFTTNHYMMLGDNRENSKDSRYWGLVREDFIIGNALFIYFPFNRMGSVQKDPASLRTQ